MSAVLCITGMHRSGTSLVASWLASCGMTIHDGHVYGPGVGNPKGHFEDVEFTDLHRRLLYDRVSDSEGWKAYVGEPMAFDAAALAVARQLIATREARFPLWGWKDPRSTLFLDQWRALLPHMKVLAVWRPCAQVAESLTARAKLTEQRDYQATVGEAVRIWTAYNQCLCDYKQAHPDQMLLYPLQHVLQHDRAVVDQVRQRLQIPLAYTPVASVYDATLLRKRTPSFRMRIAERSSGAGAIERRLLKLSDER